MSLALSTGKPHSVTVQVPKETSQNNEAKSAVQISKEFWRLDELEEPMLKFAQDMHSINREYEVDTWEESVIIEAIVEVGLGNLSVDPRWEDVIGEAGGIDILRDDVMDLAMSERDSFHSADHGPRVNVAAHRVLDLGIQLEDRNGEKQGTPNEIFGKYVSEQVESYLREHPEYVIPDRYKDKSGNEKLLRDSITVFSYAHDLGNIYDLDKDGELVNLDGMPKAGYIGEDGKRVKSKAEERAVDILKVLGEEEGIDPLVIEIASNWILMTEFIYNFQQCENDVHLLIQLIDQYSTSMFEREEQVSQTDSMEYMLATPTLNGLFIENLTSKVRERLRSSQLEVGAIKSVLQMEGVSELTSGDQSSTNFTKNMEGRLKGVLSDDVAKGLLDRLDPQRSNIPVEERAPFEQTDATLLITEYYLRKLGYEPNHSEFVEEDEAILVESEVLAAGEVLSFA